MEAISISRSAPITRRSSARSAGCSRAHLRGEQGGGDEASRPRPQLLPGSAIARIEEANGLAMLFGKARLAEARILYQEAAHCAPADAMQKLDAEHAREEG